MFIVSVMPSNHLILCCPLLLPSIFPSIRVFPMSWLFASGGQNIRASASVLLMNVQGWFPLGLTGLISLLSKELLRSSPAPQFKSINSTALSLLYGLTLTSVHDTGKTIALTIKTFDSKVMSLLFNTLSRFVKAFVPRSKHLLISWLQLPSTAIL